MASIVGICNAGLQLIKNSKQITSLEQGTKEANACEIVFDELRDAMLELHNWNFATKRAKLAQLADTPAFEFDYGYQLPSDFLRVVSCHNNATGRDRIVYKIEGGQINADVQNMYLRYIARVEDPNLMPATFRLALSKLLASRLAVTIANSEKLSQQLYEQYIGEDLPTAKSSDSIQDFPDQLPESSCVAVRYGARELYEPGDPPT